ncbi:putative response regulator of two-component system (plasmid) [Sinorhizobium fredii NGR234]|uniref:Response regulator of two-component system n=1 Tax=Sinorhizobium fredii (strain NBRC 101917 / NGR234) TaxID=394 RepID=C3KR09_SINFN|nr:response regulator transcription factor [Sinorhizobium fredii]ACP22517.1 putative response regulator of two-component system [Sinorhizobium fredii NGR234]
MRASVLIYTGNAELFLLLEYILETERFAVRLCADTSELIGAIQTEQPLAVLVDCADPSLEALGFIRRIKAIRDHMPVAAFTNGPRKDLSSCPGTLGIDVVICSPYDPRRLLAFLKGVQANLPYDSGPAASGEQIYRHADIVMNVSRIRVTRNGRIVSLTALQFRLLLRLMKMPDVVHSRDDLIAAGWPREAEVEPRTVDIHIGHIRRALNQYGPDVIRTVRSIGYSLKGSLR